MQKLAYTVKETAELMSLPEDTVRFLCKTQKLNAKRIGKRWIIPAQSIQRFLESTSRDEMYIYRTMTHKQEQR